MTGEKEKSEKRISPEIQKYLLETARNSIAEKLGLGTKDTIPPKHAAILKEKRGVFVSLHIDHQLRGCIGNIQPVYELEDGIKENARNAAFEDPRFEPLSKEEFDGIEIEISVLTVPKVLKYSDAEDLLRKLTPLKDGVIIRKGPYCATYLPQVWEQVPDKEMFLSSLCQKAGLEFDEWKDGLLEVSTYQAEVFKEE